MGSIPESVSSRKWFSMTIRFKISKNILSTIMPPESENRPLVEFVRAAMLGRANVHAHGNSGCRPEITLTLIEMLNKGVTPFVCQKGSVGASGDLAPMAQIALLMLGEGQAYYQGRLMDGRKGHGKCRDSRSRLAGSRRTRNHQRFQPTHGNECSVAL